MKTYPQRRDLPSSAGHSVLWIHPTLSLHCWTCIKQTAFLVRWCLSFFLCCCRRSKVPPENRQQPPEDGWRKPCGQAGQHVTPVAFSREMRLPKYISWYLLRCVMIHCSVPAKLNTYLYWILVYTYHQIGIYQLTIFIRCSRFFVPICPHYSNKEDWCRKCIKLFFFCKFDPS